MELKKAIRGKKGNIIFIDESGKVMLPYRTSFILKEGEEYIIKIAEEKERFFKVIPIMKKPLHWVFFYFGNDENYIYDSNSEFIRGPFTDMLFAEYLYKIMQKREEYKIISRKEDRKKIRELIEKVKEKKEKERREKEERERKIEEFLSKMESIEQEEDIIEVDEWVEIDATSVQGRREREEGYIIIEPKIPENVVEESDALEECRVEVAKMFNVDVYYVSEDERLVKIRNYLFRKNYKKVKIVFSKEAKKRLEERVKEMRENLKGTAVDVMVINEKEGFMKK